MRVGSGCGGGEGEGHGPGRKGGMSCGGGCCTYQPATRAASLALLPPCPAACPQLTRRPPRAGDLLTCMAALQLLRDAAERCDAGMAAALTAAVLPRLQPLLQHPEPLLQGGALRAAAALVGRGLEAEAAPMVLDGPQAPLANGGGDEGDSSAGGADALLPALKRVLDVSGTAEVEPELAQAALDAGGWAGMVWAAEARTRAAAWVPRSELPSQAWLLVGLSLPPACPLQHTSLRCQRPAPLPSPLTSASRSVHPGPAAERRRGPAELPSVGGRRRGVHRAGARPQPRPARGGPACPGGGGGGGARGAQQAAAGRGGGGRAAGGSV